MPCLADGGSTVIAFGHRGHSDLSQHGDGPALVSGNAPTGCWRWSLEVLI
jgi:hypothetical protein